MIETKGNSNNFKVKVLQDSVKLYLPRVDGYLEVVRDISFQYSGMSLIEFDGYFEESSNLWSTLVSKSILMISMKER